MSMTRRQFQQSILGILAIAALGLPGRTTASHPAEDVPTQRISMDAYQNFLVNWEKEPVLYALIQTPAHYNTLFHPAGVMNPKRPYAPADSLFDKEQILVVARVVTAGGNPDKVFKVERLIKNQDTLELHYQFTAPRADAGTSQEKNFLALRIPKQNFKTVLVFENDKKVGELKLEAGQWSVPAMAVEPK